MMCRFSVKKLLTHSRRIDLVVSKTAYGSCVNVKNVTFYAFGVAAHVFSSTGSVVEASLGCDTSRRRHQ